jgi:hypothetical protein
MAPCAATAPEASTQSQRSVADGQALMGVGTTRSMERVAAALGLLEKAELCFESADDIPDGGVLCALPALLAIGLLRHTAGHFALPKGFYPMESIFLLLAYLALGRVPSLEQLRYQTPGEWGKLLGLDRIPEVKTLREKVGLLGDDAERAARWSSALARDWMEQDVQAAGVLLVDGHTRVYHGKLARLPRRYVSRERLCLRGTTDYWVNALDGQPFFCLTRPIDPGLQKTLENDIVPRLLEEVPGQPTQEALSADPLLHRFILVFDREGYSPELFARLRAQRIAILCYHKFPGADWPQEEFMAREVTLQGGETERLLLAERGTCLSNDLWVREVRHLDKSGHQTSILSTAFRCDLTKQASGMFARWHQENFFKYMRQHFGLDRLVEHGVSPLPDTTLLVNPAWRALDSQVRRFTGELNRQRAAFSAHILRPQDNSPAAAARHEIKKGEALAALEQKQAQLTDLKTQRKALPKHIELKDLPASERVAQLRSGRKHFIDTIKLVAYRAETALVELARETLRRSDDARSFVRGLMQTTINLRPHPERAELRIELHGQTNPIHDEVVAKMCEELNATETCYPGTSLRLKFAPLRSRLFPGGQDV